MSRAQYPVSQLNQVSFNCFFVFFKYFTTVIVQFLLTNYINMILDNQHDSRLHSISILLMLLILEWR